MKDVLEYYRKVKDNKGDEIDERLIMLVDKPLEQFENYYRKHTWSSGKLILVLDFIIFSKTEFVFMKTSFEENNIVFISSYKSRFKLKIKQWEIFKSYQTLNSLDKFIEEIWENLLYKINK